MQHTDPELVELGSPRPRVPPRPFSSYQYELSGTVEYLPVAEISKVALQDVLANRCTRPVRDPLSLNQLGILLWYTGKTIEAGPSPSGLGIWEHRPVASAGGCHPVDQFVIDWKRKPADIRLYDNQSHSLRCLRFSQPEALEQLLAEVEMCVGQRSGTIFWYALQFERTMSRYERGESLVWRDVGVMIATTYLVSEALGLACTPAGITGEPWISALIGSDGAVVGGGGCVVGGR